MYNSVSLFWFIYLKLKTIHEYFLCPYKRQSLKLKTIHKYSLPLLKADLHATLHCIARSTGTRERGTFTTQVKRYTIGVEASPQLESKQQFMQNNVETQHKHMYSLYIGSLCNVAFPVARFTCIVTSQVFVKIWMRWSIVLNSAFYRGRKYLWIVFSYHATLHCI